MDDKKISIMRDEKISKALVKLSAPIILGMLINAIYSLVDAFFVGGLGTSQMGAVAVTFPISMVVVGLGLMFGSGAGSYISRLLGEKNDIKAHKTASTALISSIFVGVVVIAGILVFLESVLFFLGATDTIMPYAKGYALIFISGSILNVINVTMNNIVASEGNAKVSMIAMLMGAGLNVILDPVFIYGFNLGVNGAAIATVLAQFLTTLFYLRYILSGKGYVKIALKHFELNKEIYIQIFKVGIPTLVFQILTSVAIGLINTASSNYGDSAVAAMGIVTRIFSIFTYIVFGYSKGFQPVAGYNYGAKNYERLWEAINVSVKWITCFCFVGTLAMLIFARGIISLFSDDPLVIDIGAKALRANSILFSFFGFQLIYVSLFLAIGRAKEGGILSMCRQGIFFVPAILILPKIFGLNGIIYTQTIADSFTILLTFVFSMRLRKEINTLRNQNIERVVA